MTRLDTAVLGAPCWIDLFSSDPDRAEEFYGRVLGWTAERGGPEFGHYVTFSRDGARVAGMMRNDGEAGQPDAWTTYLATADAKGTAEAAVAAGGHVVVEPMQVADLGSMAVLVDAGGAPFGLWQPGAHRGFQIAAEAGAPVWFELHTNDYTGSVAFYERALGAQTSVMSDTDEFRYTQLVVEGQPHAGIMDRGDSLTGGASWQVYFGVTDTDASVDLVTQLGGAVLTPAEDTPFGRLAQVADATGAVFRLASVPAG